jgi:hypothetical protein
LGSTIWEVDAQRVAPVVLKAHLELAPAEAAGAALAAFDVAEPHQPIDVEDSRILDERVLGHDPLI